MELYVKMSFANSPKLRTITLRVSGDIIECVLLAFESTSKALFGV